MRRVAGIIIIVNVVGVFAFAAMWFHASWVGGKGERPVWNDTRRDR